MNRFVLVCAMLVVALVSSSVPAQDSGSAVLKKLEAFARTFGYVRYFHPSDQAALVDWDAMAYFGTQEMLNSNEDESLQQLIERLFSPVVVDLEIYSGKAKPLPETRKVPADQIVAWQHVGIGFGKPGLYRSVRINRARQIDQPTAGPFGNVLTSIAATELRGEKIRYRFDAKVEQGNCRLQGWWRVDRDNKRPGLFENMGDRPIRAKQWKKYELTGTVDDDADRLTLGVMFVGTGSGLIDNVQLEKNVDGHWQPIPVSDPDFETSEDQPVGWTQTVDGYSMELETEDVSHGKQAVRIARGSKMEKAKPLFDRVPELGTVVDAEIAPDLRLRMPLALPVESRYQPGDDGATDAWIDKINATPTDSADQKVASLANAILMWNVFQHFYPYFEQVDTDWDATLRTGLKNGLAANDRQTATQNLKWIVAQLHDGHGMVFDPRADRGLAAVKFEWIEDHLVVTASDNDNFQVGDIVVDIDGQPSDDFLKQSEEYISGSPQWKRHQSTRLLAQGSQPKMVAAEP